MSSAFRAHFTSTTSHRSAKANTVPDQTSTPSTKQLSSKDGTSRHPSKLAKKSSRLPATVENTSRAKRPIPQFPSAMGQSRPAPTAIPQVRNQMLASGSPARDVLSPPPVLRTPSLISGSSVSTFDSPRSNMLRRKPSTIERFVAKKRSEATDVDVERAAVHSRAEGYTEAMDDAVFGISMPATRFPPSTTPLSSITSDSLYATSGTYLSNTPSTRYTDSPYSHVPTPSSFSSQSTAPTTFAGNKLSQEMGRSATVSPIEAMRQEKARDSRNSMKAHREADSIIPQTNRAVQTVHIKSTGNTARAVLPARSDSKLNNATRGNTPSRSPTAYPELAHLNELSPRKQHGPLPVRPSREGASGITIAQPLSPVVQSDLPPATFHQRTSSRDSFGSTSSQGFRSRLGLSPKLTTGRDSPSMSVNMSYEASVQEDSVHRSTPAPTASPVKTHRFGFLTRKPKDEPAKPVEKPKREPRKMPVAGTGHERYGRFGFGPRHGSISSSAGGRSPSTDSISSTKSSSLLRRKSSGASDKASELDEFLRDRLAPVVLRGSGGDLSGTTASSDKLEADSVHSKRSSIQGKPVLTTSVSQISLPKRASVQAHEMVRPASARPSTSTAKEPLPHTQYAAESQDGKEGLWLRPLIEAEKQPAKKWNFLQRLQSSPSKTRQGTFTSQPLLDPRRNQFDNAAHSALMDAIEPIDLGEVERLVLEEDLAPTKQSEPSLSATNGPGRRLSLLPSPSDVESKSRRLSTLPVHEKRIPLIPPRPKMLKPMATVPVVKQQASVSTPELKGDESPRIPRLSPVGRIPRVVSKRDQDRKLPDASFSRPFATSQPRPNVKPPGALYNQIRDLASPVEPAVQDFPSSSIPSTQEYYTPDQYKRSSRGDSAMHSTTNLFAFPSRKNSDFSYSSSSDTASWLAYSRMQAIQDEDVWDEYDDLMDDAALGKLPMYHKASFSSHQSPPCREMPPTHDVSYFGLPPTREPTHALPQPPKPKPSREGSSTSMTQAGQQQSMYSLTRAMLSRQSTMSGTSISSSRNSRISTRSRAASMGEQNVRSSNTSFSSTARANRESMKAQEVLNDMQPSVNLKLEALMTSKLLSFGRVLFSPAHNEMRLSDEPRVLILDGLGSDWSYFVAMFYPQATIYNLGPSGKQGNTRDGWQQLPNHRNIAHTSVGHPLPFPKGFFTAAVFRFPVATTDQAYHSCITEFKRVLRPGGYLEVSVLDIDLGNAGMLARKAVRGLKTRMQQRQENISLRSLSDFVLQSIGKRGFEEVQRCIIGVPIVCRTQGSDESSVTSEVSTARSPSKQSQRNSHRALVDFVESAQQTQSDFNESSDEKMTKSVARVGRWWYSQCYERSVLNTDQSIWNNHALLSECQNNATSLRLLICYAQKPSQARRRTMSV